MPRPSEQVTPVVRYVITKVGKDGLRTLAQAAQGRYTYATDAEARAVLTAILSNNSVSTLQSVYGDLSKMTVEPCNCWPGHFDPMGVYFDN